MVGSRDVDLFLAGEYLCEYSCTSEYVDTAVSAVGSAFHCSHFS